MNKVVKIYPLNDTQKVILYSDPTIDAVTNTAMRIRGKIDIDKLEKTLAAIVARHDALRMVVEKDETGTHVNKLVDEFEVKLNVVKLGDGTHEEKEKEMIEVIGGIGDEISKRDSVNDWKIPFRFTLFDFGNDEYVLLVVILHLVTDGVSNTIIMGEIVSLYNDTPLSPVTKSFSSVITEYIELKNSEEGQKFIQTYEDSIKDYDESFIEFADDGHGNREPRNLMTTMPLDKISAFTRKNKMSNVDLTMFLFHLTVASVFGTDFTVIKLGSSNRTIETRSAVGCIASPDLTTLRFDDTKTLAELLDDFKKRNNARERNPFSAHFSLRTSFVLSYINYYRADSTKMPFGKDATVEPYPNIEFAKLWSFFAMIAVECGNELIIKGGYDPDVFTPEIREKFSACMHSGLNCLSENGDITFEEFKKLQ